MNVGKIYSVQTDLASSYTIEIEVDINKKGIPAFAVVGLPDKAVEESRERVAGALKNSGFDSPKKYKTVVALSPAALKKEGAYFDLPIAIGLLLANQDEYLSFDPTGICIIGELSLEGTVRPIKGALALVQHAQKKGFHSIYLPEANAQEAALIEGITVYPVDNLKQLALHLHNQASSEQQPSLAISPQAPTPYQTDKHKSPEIDFADIVDQAQAKRALTIAAAGGHNVAMYGPAGTGKTMLAKAFANILPPLNYQQMLESTAIHSYHGILEKTHLTSPPFRAPHHTSSHVSVIGGGVYPKPGEVSLAHNGVLFLDEFPEFDKRVLESLREPLEDREVRIARARGSVTFPARICLVAAMNPPSAVYRDPYSITPAIKRNFEKKISGPIMDRIDLWTEVSSVAHEKLLENNKPTKEQTSHQLQAMVEKARNIQETRLGQGRTNATMSVQEIQKHIFLDPSTRELVNRSARKLELSPRVYHKILKLARTIADLEESPDISDKHILEALSYRPRSIS